MSTEYNGIEVFRDICVSLYEESDICEFDSKNKIKYSDNYIKVIMMVLKTKYKDLLPIDGLTLEQIGFLLGTTRERIRQIQESALGADSKVRNRESKQKRKIGKIRNPDFGGMDKKEKIEGLIDLKDYFMEVYGYSKKK
jgi:hypothetical protein